MQSCAPLQRACGVGIPACFPPRRQLWDRLRWNVLSRGWRRVRNPYFLLSREICTAARCNNLSISSKHQTHSAGQKRSPLFFFSLFRKKKSPSHPRQEKNTAAGREQLHVEKQNKCCNLQIPNAVFSHRGETIKHLFSRTACFHCDSESWSDLWPKPNIHPH